mgnify:CR=1 FL=1
MQQNEELQGKIHEIERKYQIELLKHSQATDGIADDGADIDVEPPEPSKPIELTLNLNTGKKKVSFIGQDAVIEPIDEIQ